MCFKVQIIGKNIKIKTKWGNQKQTHNLILWRRNKLFTIKTYYKHYDLDRK